MRCALSARGKGTRPMRRIFARRDLMQLVWLGLGVIPFIDGCAIDSAAVPSKRPPEINIPNAAPTRIFFAQKPAGSTEVIRVSTNATPPAPNAAVVLPATGNAANLATAPNDLSFGT